MESDKRVIVPTVLWFKEKAINVYKKCTSNFKFYINLNLYILSSK